MAFPQQVNVQQAPAVAGDFAGRNPRVTVDAGQGALVAGTGGLTVGAFAWADPTNTTVSNAGTAAPTGFVAREQQGTIVTYLADAGFSVLPGYPVTLFSAGDFFVHNAGTNTTTIGMKAFANNTTGQITFGATGTAPTGTTETKWIAASVAAPGELVIMSSHQLG